MKLRAFRALRYEATAAGPASETSAPPYSDPDPFDHATHRTSNPYTVLELLTTDPAVTTAGRYATARATLDRWCRTGVLAEDDEPGLVVYEQRDGEGHVQRGLVGLIALEDVDEGTLLLHEDVDGARARARANRLRHVPVDLTPVVAVHLGAPPVVHTTLQSVCASRPDIAFTDEQAVAHRLWRITDPDVVGTLVRGVADVTAVLADGHHRLAAARRLARDPDAPAGAGHTLAMVLDAAHEGPRLRAVHRLVRWTRDDLPDRLAEMDGVSVQRWPGTPGGLAAELERPGPRRFGVVTTSGTWLVSLHNGTGEPLLVDLGIPDVLRQLDMVVLREVLFPVMDVVDDRAIAEVDAAVTALSAPAAADGTAPPDALVLLSPPTVGQVLEVARSGLRMPAKTTWFWPKPRAGLVMRRLDTTVPTKPTSS
ncbi:DUF1015 family protein [Euzebya rosea]|uniref:DUF1015 family protein n=1 Tax=Euzebya rosea TaxID=2052804 RepID=UPI00130074AC|nr:DUF1015 family protein [Euzebya rosea]